MNKISKIWILVAVLGLSLSARAETCPRLPLQGTGNPDPARIKVRGSTVNVLPAGTSNLVAHPLATANPYAGDVFALNTENDPKTVTEDVRNLQWAVQNAGRGGTVRLAAGTFDFGAIGGIYVPGINLVGAGVDGHGNPRSIIQGGRSALRISFNCSRDAVKIDGLWLRGASGRAVFSGLSAYDRLQFSGNLITDVVALYEDITPIGKGTVSRGLWADGDRTGGDASFCKIDEIDVRGNVFDSLASDAEFYDTALQVQSCNFKSLKIHGNEFRVLGGAIEVTDNTFAASEVAVRDNSIDMLATDPLAVNTGITMLFTGSKKVTVADNEIHAGAVGGTLGLFLSTAAANPNYQVRGNYIALDAGVAGIAMGFPDTPLSGALVSDNIFAGNISLVFAAFDLSFAGGATYHNDTHDNTFRDNDLTGVEHFDCHVYFDSGVHDNVFSNNKGLRYHEDTGLLDCDAGTNNRVVPPRRR